jgi:alpha-L-arabinofuranosidase
MSHKELLPLSELEPWVQDALDAIEYANGPVTSKWGAARAANGHPKPFNLKYLEIGNENGLWSGFGGVLGEYEPRYRAFYDAVKAKYPQIVCIANTRGNFKADMVDDHYYNSPDWFWANAGLYDNADRNGPKVYVGEYAVTSQCGIGNLRAALGEAAFLIGLERNADHVQLASYAPLFVHEQDRRWNPDAIVFNNTTSYGTPSFWVQTMFALHKPLQVYKTAYSDLRKAAGPGSVGLGAWRTSVEYKDAVLSAGGRTTKLDANLKRTPLGQLDFRAENGTFISTSRKEPDAFFFDSPELKKLQDYTFEVKAKKIAGDEGFLILIRAQDAQNFLWLNLGGWGNTAHNVEKASGGGQSPIAKGVPGKIETGRWYNVRVECKGPEIRCYLDGKEVLTAQDRSAPTFIAGAGPMEKNVMAVKLINAGDEPVNVTLDLRSWEAYGESTMTVLTANSLDAENSFNNPTAIVPKTSVLKLRGTNPKVPILARSANMIRLTVKPK